MVHFNEEGTERATAGTEQHQNDLNPAIPTSKEVKLLWTYIPVIQQWLL